MAPGGGQSGRTGDNEGHHMTAISYATAVDPRTLPFKDRRGASKVAAGSE